MPGVEAANTELLTGAHRYEVIFTRFDDEFQRDVTLCCSFLHADSEQEAVDKACKANPQWSWLSTEVKAVLSD